MMPDPMMCRACGLPIAPEEQPGEHGYHVGCARPPVDDDEPRRQLGRLRRVAHWARSLGWGA